MTVEEKKISGTLPILLLVFVSMAVALFSIFSNLRAKEEVQHLELLTEQYQLAYNTVFEQYRQLSETLFSCIRDRYDIRNVYQKLLTADEEQKDTLRQELLSSLTPRYLELKDSIKLRELQFHLRNNESFLRLHSPERYGDNLSGIRATVEYVNTNHSPIFGFEEGRMLNGYRYIFPVTGSNEKHLGSVEITFGPDAFVSSIMKQYDVFSNFLINRKISIEKKFSQEKLSYYMPSPNNDYFYDTDVLATLAKFSHQSLGALKPGNKTRETMYGMVNNDQAGSTYDQKKNMVYTVLPVVQPVTHEINAFLTVRSYTDFFVNLRKHFWSLFLLSLFLLFFLLTVFYLQTGKRKIVELSKRKALELKNREMSEQSQALIDAKEAAETANKAKSVFLSNMSHELRTPLNSILGYTQIFAGDSSLTPQQLSGIKTMHQSGQHLLMLINDILDLSKIEADKMELVTTDFRLSTFLKGIEDIIRVRSQKKGLKFICGHTGSLPVIIKADELRLRQVILNLLSNSVKFTDKGYCTFIVKAENIDGYMLRLTVIIEDSGPGIVPQMQEKIFSPFQQSGDRLKYSEGSGLGLTISRKIIRLMGGDLQVTSPLNKHPRNGEGVGSRFFFSIDVAMLSVARIAGKKDPQVCGYISMEKGGHAAGDKAPDDQKKILIVDDKLSNRAVLHDILAPIGFITSEAKDGCEVIPACERQQPDAILMDLRMPIIDGFSATKLIKTHPHFSHIPVIAISATVATQDTVTKRCRKHGFSAYINKPYSTIKLLETLARELKIELQYECDEAEDSLSKDLIMVSPSQEILKQIQTLSTNGDIDSIERLAKEIVTMDDGRYKAFAQMLQLFAEDFQLSEIEKFVARYRKK